MEGKSGGKSVGTVVLRVLAVVSFLASIIILYFSSQKQESKKVRVVAEYQQWNGFQFSMVVNAIGLVYNVIVFLIPDGSQLWNTVVVADVIMNILIGMSIASSWQTYSLMRQGNAHVGWCSICRLLPFFCSKLLGSLIASSFGFLVSFLLLMSILNVSVNPFLRAQ